MTEKRDMVSIDRGQLAMIHDYLAMRPMMEIEAGVWAIRVALGLARPDVIEILQEYQRASKNQTWAVQLNTEIDPIDTEDSDG